MCDEIRLALAEVRWRTPLASLRGTPGGRSLGPSSMGPRLALLLLLLLHHQRVALGQPGVALRRVV